MGPTRVLDRRVSFDERSRNFPVRTLIAPRSPRNFTWRCRAYLDQGTEGACVGYSIAHEIAATPVAGDVTTEIAHRIYEDAQRLDEWPGEDYDGTSVLGGMKAATALGYYREYRWAFGLDDLILAVGYQGPAVLGINWYESMMEPEEDGYLRPRGAVSGGHAILCRGVSLQSESFLLHNSWGRDWGWRGTARISWEDLRRLLAEDGEAAVPLSRGWGSTTSLAEPAPQ